MFLPTAVNDVSRNNIHLWNSDNTVVSVFAVIAEYFLNHSPATLRERHADLFREMIEAAPAYDIYEDDTVTRVQSAIHRMVDILPELWD